MKNIPKIVRIIAILLAFQFQTAYSQNSVDISIISLPKDISSILSTNMSEVLKVINTAYNEDKTPVFNRANITVEAIKEIQDLWEISGKFRTVDNMITTRGAKASSGYCVRNITMKIYVSESNSEMQDFAFRFNAAGIITSVNFALQKHQYSALLRAEHDDEVDLRRRNLVLETVEQFRTAYNRKDMNYLKAIYSDDALIITGKVLTPVADGIKIPDKQVVYQEQTKGEYLTGLQKVFNNNKYINITFESISLVRHPAFPAMYGVTLKQKWRTTNYNDNGWLFLLIDFEHEDKPLIHVRTWQPNVPEDDVFQLGDFNIVE